MWHLVMPCLLASLFAFACTHAYPSVVPHSSDVELKILAIDDPDHPTATVLLANHSTKTLTYRALGDPLIGVEARYAFRWYTAPRGLGCGTGTESVLLRPGQELKFKIFLDVGISRKHAVDIRLKLSFNAPGTFDEFVAYSPAVTLPALSRTERRRREEIVRSYPPEWRKPQ